MLQWLCFFLVITMILAYIPFPIRSSPPPSPRYYNIPLLMASPASSSSWHFCMGEEPNVLQTRGHRRNPSFSAMWRMMRQNTSIVKKNVVWSPKLKLPTRLSPAWLWRPLLSSCAVTNLKLVRTSRAMGHVHTHTDRHADLRITHIHTYALDYSLPESIILENCTLTYINILTCN